MKACVIATSKNAATNVGDTLIADRCSAMVRDAVDGKVEVKTLFQGAAWDQIEDDVRSSDAVFFACLAIRRRIFEKNYRFVPEMLKTNVPVFVISAGISLSGFSSPNPIKSLMSDEEINGLRALADRSAFFSSRGYLSQSFLSQVGVSSTFAGDVAFYQPRFSNRSFRAVRSVERIAVSDPHYAEGYKNSFLYLIEKLRDQFPDAKIDLLVHGTNEEAAALATEVGIDMIELWGETGLDLYDDYDLHVGYRVHGHVSALSRRKPSYLLEQDDRGIDYGATLSRRVTFASHRNISRGKQVLSSPVEALASVLRQDAEDGFSRFQGLEPELESFGSKNLEGVRNALRALH